MAGFVDVSELRSHLEKEGYSIFPLLDDAQITELKSFYEALGLADTQHFHASLFDDDADLKKRIDEKIRTTAGKQLEKILDQHRAVIGSYVVKYPGKHSMVYPHQDWNFVDETKHASLNCWIALDDMDHENGALYLLPGSRDLPYALRGTNITSSIVGATPISIRNMKPMILKAGEALVYDHRMIHASPPNKTDKARMAAAVVLIPKEAELIHYAKMDGRFYRYRVDRDFYYKQRCVDEQNMALPEGYDPETEVPYKEYVFQDSMLFPNESLWGRLRRKILSRLNGFTF